MKIEIQHKKERKKLKLIPDKYMKKPLKENIEEVAGESGFAAVFGAANKNRWRV